MTVSEIKERLDELGVDYPSRANKTDLQAILEKAEAGSDDVEDPDMDQLNDDDMDQVE